MTSWTVKSMALAALLVGASAWGQTPVKVDEAWVRGTVPQQKATGAFMRLTAEADVRLVGARASVAGVTEVHEMVLDSGVMKMRPVPAVALPAGRTTELKPGGLHVMLMDLKQPLKASDTVVLTLEFEDAQKKRFSQEVNAPVKALATPAAPAGHGAHQH